MATSSSRFLCFALFLCLATASTSVVHAQLTANFYSRTCPSVRGIISSAMSKAVASDNRIGASVLRLFFHDCFVQGCDASILLDGSSEKNARPNQSLNPDAFDLIDTIKTSVEASCPGVVSCADILAIATVEGVEQLRGPSWTLGLGRKDSTTASSSTSSLIPSSSSLAQLISTYGDLGFSVTDMVALSGAHTIGQAQCNTFRRRIYNDTNINASFATLRQSTCPPTGSTTLAPLDQTPNNFDNNFFKNLLDQRGLLRSDQELFNNGSTDSLVITYSTNQGVFFTDFASAMAKMSNLSPPGGIVGEIRKNCRVAN